MQYQPTYFVYRYIRLDKNVPFYIGMGKRLDFNSQGYPLYSHKSIYGRAYSKDRNKVCLGIMEKSEYEVEIIYETPDKKHAEEKEKEFISLYGCIYDGSGTLVNLTEGGISFKPKEELKRQNEINIYNKKSVYKCFKKVYMYDLEGNFIEKFDSLTGFNKKYRFGDKNGQGISQSIRLKTSYLGYYFSFEDYIDITTRINTAYNVLPIVLFDENKNPIKWYYYLEEAAKELKITCDNIYRVLKRKSPENGMFFERVKIHELSTMFDLCCSRT